MDLTGAPELRPYQTLRMKERARIMAVAELGGMSEPPVEGQPVKQPTLTETFALLAEMDDAMEFVAVDKAQYVEWLTSDKGGEQGLTALFSRYAQQVGKSSSSAT